MNDRSVRRVPPVSAAVRAIALNTFREAVRDRILYLLLAFALLLIVVSRLLSLLTVGNENKIIKDVGLSAISVFGVLTAVFVGVSLVFKEIERRTVYTLLANPVRRWQFVVGKYAGLVAVLAMNLGVMSLTLFAILLIRGESPWSLVPAIATILVELAMITAFALLFSSLTNPVLAALFTATTYVAGHLSWSLMLLKEKTPVGVGRWLCDVLYALLPNLDRMDFKTEAVGGILITPGTVGLAVLYGAGYTTLVLVLACWAFGRREFV